MFVYVYGRISASVCGDQRTAFWELVLGFRHVDPGIDSGATPSLAEPSARPNQWSLVI